MIDRVNPWSAGRGSLGSSDDGCGVRGGGGWLTGFDADLAAVAFCRTLARVGYRFRAAQPTNEAGVPVSREGHQWRPIEAASTSFDRLPCQPCRAERAT